MLVDRFNFFHLFFLIISLPVFNNRVCYNLIVTIAMIFYSLIIICIFEIIVYVFLPTRNKRFQYDELEMECCKLKLH